MAVRAPGWKGWTRITIGIHFLVILGLGLSSHWGYLSSLIDLGAFDQAIWGTLHGDFLLNTAHFGEPTSRLGMHFNPFLVAFVPLYALAPWPEWLILAMALALSLSAWPIFLLASHVLKSDKAGFLWVLIYLANPFLLNAAAWDFHAAFLAVPFIALAMLAVTTGDGRLLVLSCLPLFFIQEQLGLTVAGFGLLWGFRHRSWKIGLGLVVSGIVHAALVLGVVMPAFSPTGGHVMLSSSEQLGRYAWLGSTPQEMVSTLLTRPWHVLHMVFVDMRGWQYLALHMGLFLALPIAALTFLLPGLADLAANMLSANPMPRTISSYHSATLVPVFTAAAIHGLARVGHYQKRYSRIQLSGLVLIVSLLVGYRFAPLPLPGATNVEAPAYYATSPDRAVAVVRKVVGEQTSISVQSNIGAYFSQREEVYLFPQHVGTVDAVVVRLQSPTTRLFPQNSATAFTLAHHLGMHPADYLARIECLLCDQRYEVAYWQDSWLVFLKNPGNKSHIQHGELKNKLEHLKQNWQVHPEDFERGLKQCEPPVADPESVF